MKVRRFDNGRTVEVSESDIRWWLDHGNPEVKLAMMHAGQLRGDVPYIRKEPDSFWAVRVEILPPEDDNDPGPQSGSACPPLVLAFRSALETEVSA